MRDFFRYLMNDKNHGRPVAVFSALCLAGILGIVTLVITGPSPAASVTDEVTYTVTVPVHRTR